MVLEAAKVFTSRPWAHLERRDSEQKGNYRIIIMRRLRLEISEKLEMIENLGQCISVYAVTFVSPCHQSPFPSPTSYVAHLTVFHHRSIFLQHCPASHSFVLAISCCTCCDWSAQLVVGFEGIGLRSTTG